MTSTPAASRVRRRVSAAVAILLVAAAAVLTVGVLLERHTESGAEHSLVVATGEPADGHHDECADGVPAEPGGPAAGGPEAAERLTGISAESPWIVTLGTIVSIALAVAVWRRPNRAVIGTVVVFSAAALILDVLEVAHQLAAERIALAVLAGLIVVLRVAAILGCGYLYQSRPAVA